MYDGALIDGNDTYAGTQFLSKPEQQIVWETEDYEVILYKMCLKGFDSRKESRPGLGLGELR